MTAGDTDSFTVTAYDQYRNVASGYTGTVTLTISPGITPDFFIPGSPSVPPLQMVTLTHTFTSTDAGQFSFQAVLTAVGPYIITAGDGTLTSNTGVTVQPGNVVGLQILDFPATVIPGQAVPFTVAARDAFGNLVFNYNPTVTFSSNDPNAVLPSPAPLAGGWAASRRRSTWRVRTP